MEKRKHILWELILLLGSVFVFRGIWQLMDLVSFLNRIDVLFVSVIIGAFLMSIGYYRLIHAY